MATYYVTKAGNDITGDGSEARPWLTIGHAYPLLSDGDTLLVGDGTYTSNVNLDVRANGTDWVTVQAINPRQVTITGSGNGFSTWAASCHYVKFVGLVFTSWSVLRFAGSEEWHSHIWIEDCEFSYSNYGILFHNAEYITVKNCYYHDNFTEITFGISGQSYCRHVLMEDVDIEHNTEYEAGRIDGITMERNKNNNDEDCDIVFRRVTSHRNADSGFDIKPAGVLFDTCQAYDNKGTGFKAWGINARFVNCLSHGNYHGWELGGNYVSLDHCTSYGNAMALRANMTQPPTLTLKNSIFGSMTDKRTPAYVVYSDIGSGVISTDHNVYFCDEDGDWLYREFGGPNITWAQRDSWTTRGAHSLLGDPLLGSDYIPTAGSPALGLGDDGLNAGWLGEVVNRLHVAGLTVALGWKGPPKPNRHMAVATVAVADQLGRPVEGVLVRGFWSRLASDSDAAVTGADGTVALYSNSSGAPRGRFVWTVTGLSRAGWVWDMAAGVATSGTAVLE